MRYVIAWKERNGSNKGRGETSFPKAIAEAIAETLNKEVPSVKHWIEPEEATQ